MPILSLVTYAIGPSIAKAILKLWLKDQGILPDVIPDLLDLLKSAAQGQSDQRQAARRMEDLGVQVVQLLQPVFDDAGPSFGDTGRAAVAQELAATLAVARIQPRVLVECNLDPALLSRYLASARPNAAKLLSADEEALYQRLLAETARAITEIGTGLQGFDTAYTAASLQDTDKILEMVSAIWQRPAEAEQEFAEKYNAIVKQQLDKLELFGLPKWDESVRAQRLTRVYITLQFERQRRINTGNKGAQLTLFDEADELTLTRLPGTTPRLEGPTLQKGDIDQLLAFARRLVIRGDAGSGKSTLLQWLAVRSASRSFTGALAGWNNTIPFFIRLRERVDRDFPAPEEFPQLIAKSVAGMMPQGWVHRQLDSGRALVLVDGIDELPQAQRDGLFQSLTSLVTAYPLARYIITSRPAVLKDDDWPAWSEWTTAEGFTDASLQPMTPEQVNLLIQQWHDALTEKIMDPVERAEVAELPTKLRRTLRLRPALRRLTTNPLLCSMICALHRDSRENLPSERLKLYESCVELLIVKRDQGRTMPLGFEYAHLTLGQLLSLVQSFAYWMMRNNYSDVSIDEAEEQFEAKLPAVGASSENGKKVRRLLVERTNLLREPIDGRIDFTHRTFQEFLAAQQAVKDNDFGVLINKATDDQWRELIILAAGVARPKEAAKFLPRLVKRAQELKRDPLRHRVLLLAIACLETCVELDPAARAYVIDQASSLFPPKDDDEARLVSAASDPAIQLLAYKPQHTTAESVACVRALAQIGSAAAMHAIAPYMEHPDHEVIETIVEAWDLFDRAEYARHVLTKGDSLVIPLLTSWDGFEHLRHLKALAIVELAPEVNLDPLYQLTVLTVFSLGVSVPEPAFHVSATGRQRFRGGRRRRTQQQPETTSTRSSANPVSPATVDLTPVASLPSLEYLSLSMSAVCDLTPLASLTNLRHLDLYGTSINDLTPLAGLTSLTQLNLESDTISDLTPLTGNINLTELFLMDAAVSDLTPLIGLSNLTKLWLLGMTASDLTPLAGLTNLTLLNLSVATVNDLTPLVGLTQLKNLTVDNVTVNDLTPLVGLTQLTALSVNSAIVNDLTPLASLTQLTELSVNSTTVNDLTPLAKLTNLTKLSLRSAALSDLTPLADLTSLTKLIINSPLVRDLVPLAGLARLTELSLVHFAISDLTPLAGLTRLTKLILDSTVKSDLTPLAGLTRLTKLYLNEILFDKSQIEKLQLSLTQLKINEY